MFIPGCFLLKVFYSKGLEYILTENPSATKTEERKHGIPGNSLRSFFNNIIFQILDLEVLGFTYLVKNE